MCPVSWIDKFYYSMHILLYMLMHTLHKFNFTNPFLYSSLIENAELVPLFKYYSPNLCVIFSSNICGIFLILIHVVVAISTATCCALQERKTFDALV